MVLDEDLHPLHELTEEGKMEYQRMLKAASDYKEAHPFLWRLEKILAGVWNMLFK